MNALRAFVPHTDADEVERLEAVAAWEERLDAFGIVNARAPRFALGGTLSVSPDLFLPAFGIHVAVESVDGDDDGGSTWAEEFASAVGPLLVVRGEPMKPFLAGGGRPETGSRLFCYATSLSAHGIFEARAFFARMPGDPAPWLAVETGDETRVLSACGFPLRRIPRVVSLDSEAQTLAVLRTWELEP